MKAAAVQALQQKKQNIFTVCKVCGQQLKKLTNSHLKRHGLTLPEYISKHEPEQARQQNNIAFLNGFYITIRSRWLEYSNGKAYTVSKRAWKLNDADIADHLSGKKGLGIYFPQKISKFIGLDIDSLDRELLNRVYNAVRRYGIEDTSILMSFSGNKGYHLDIFLTEPIDKIVIKRFYEAICCDIDATPEQVELRGGGGQAYKLPLGYHYKTGAYCCPVDEWGNEIPLKDRYSKIDSRVIFDAVDINYIPDQFAALKLEYEELSDQVKLLEIHSRTNELSIKQVEKLIDSGVNEANGRRHVSVRTIAAYCKDVKGYCLGETVDFLKKWIGEKWSKQIGGAEWLKNAEITARSVFKTGFKFHVHANTISISLPDIREVFSLETGNRLQDEALRRLYYILLLHSKAYADNDGVFFMSRDQMRAMGATADPNNLLQQLEKLAAMGKLMFISRNQNAGKGSRSKTFKRPNSYKLNCFDSYEKEIPGQRAFNVCGKSEKCSHCFYNALAYLATDRERQKHIKGKEFKQLPGCDYNR